MTARRIKGTPVSRWVRWRRRLLVGGPVLAVLFYLAATRGLYFFPTSVALGPCLRDWTNGATWTTRNGELESPMASVRFAVGEAHAEVCYGRPSAHGRRVFGPAGAVVPNGRLWRMGANEPTRLFIDRKIEFENLELDPGRYSFYAIPGEANWTIFVTRSTFHWGNQITDAVRAQEVGSVRVPVQETEHYVETLTMHASESEEGTELVIEWADTRLGIRLHYEP